MTQALTSTSRGKTLCWLLALVVACLAFFAGGARAAIQVTEFSGQVTLQDGSPATQAGSHPAAAATQIRVGNRTDVDGSIVPVEDPRDLLVDLPAGFVGNPVGIPRCASEEISGSLPHCPVGSQVGVVEVDTGVQTVARGVYNMVPRRGDDRAPGVAASFAFNVLGVVVSLDAGVGIGPDGQYAVRIASRNISQGLSIVGSKVTLWGVPADAANDAQRCQNPEYVPGAPLCTGPDGDLDFGPNPAGQPRRPLISLPSDCSAGLLTTHLRADSWQDSGVFATASFDHDVNGVPMAVDGCNRVPFGADADVALDTRSADTPTGLEASISVSQTSGPDALSTAHLKQVSIDFPAGLAINPSAADGLGSCTPAQIGIGSESRPTCPDASKVGSVAIETPVLENTLNGSIYLAQQGINPFNSTLAVYLVADDPVDGVLLKVAGKVSPDLTTGRLRATFDDNPQLPFSRLDVRLTSGARAPLVTPPTCGIYEIHTQLSPWSAADPSHPTSGEIVSSTSQFVIDHGPGGGACLAGDPNRPGDPTDLARRPFAPGATAGTLSNAVGSFSPFSLGVTRADGHQEISSLKLDLPTGLTAKLAGVSECSDAALASISNAEGTGRNEVNRPSCPANSQVGTATVGVGAGSNPYYVQTGKAYLAGPYKGAPFSLAVVAPAVAGPFDLGTVVVRSKLDVDPDDAQVHVSTDDLPTILAGVPLRLRDIRVNIDRPGFTLNPTSCASKTIDGAVGSVTGAAAALSVRFQAGGCSDLALKPSLGLSLSGKGQTTDGKHPAVTATLTQKSGQANLRKVRVALPLSLALDPDNANGLCEFVDGTKTTPTCPKASIVGTATATTPILDQPLSGPVYFVKNIRRDPKSGRDIRTLPKLVIPLVGQNGVKLTLTGTSNVENDQLVTTFDNIPDAPVSSFRLSIIGGKGGILTVSGADICKATQVADQQIDGQNNKAADADVFIQTPSCPLKLLSKKVGKTSVAIKIGGLGAGKVTVTGHGIKKTSKTITKSTVATIVAKRTKGKPGKVTVSFDPTGPAKARKTTK